MMVWVIGGPWHEAATIGSLLGTKVVLNELPAYLDLANLPAGVLATCMTGAVIGMF